MMSCTASASLLKRPALLVMLPVRMSKPISFPSVEPESAALVARRVLAGYNDEVRVNVSIVDALEVHALSEGGLPHEEGIVSG